jgi:hypothetical protein
VSAPSISRRTEEQPGDKMLPVKEDAVAKGKTSFLGIFGELPGSVDWQSTALRDSLLSSLQRNPTYTPGTTDADKAEFRSVWRQRLIDLADEYAHATKDRKGFESDVVGLQTAMDGQFRSILQPLSSTYPSGFRVAHAQKSLSLMLKHSWCNGFTTEPPACPVDRLILTVANAPYGNRTWTSVNTVAQYREQLGFLDRAAEGAGQSLAVWELLNFKPEV